MIITIGASFGGLKAIKTILSTLPANFSAVIIFVQHRDKETDDLLAELMQRVCFLPVCEIEDKDTILPGHIYLAPPDYHLLVERGHFALSIEAPVRYTRPSIDVLFETAAEIYGEEVIGVILSGANNDGTRGLAAIKQCGGLTIAQNPATAECPVMPRSAIEAGVVDKVLTLEEIGPFLVSNVVEFVNLARSRNKSHEHKG